VYHIGGDVELTNRELVTTLLDACGAGADRVVGVPDRKGHDRRYSLDDTLLRSMGYAPARPFRESLLATVRWYAENRDWWEPLKTPGGAARPGDRRPSPAAGEGLAGAGHPR
jgi:dTDP-glucose 4,6-dehydratase